MSDNHLWHKRSAVRLLALALCTLCSLAAHAFGDYRDDVFEYVDYETESDGTNTVVVSGIYKVPANGVLSVPASITVEGSTYKVVGWDAGASGSEVRNCRKIILPETFRELGVTVSGTYHYATFDELIPKGLKEIEVKDGNKWFKSDNGMLLSADGKKLYYISAALAATPDLVIPEGVEYIYCHEKDFYNYEYGEIRNSITLPSTLKYTNAIYICYPYIILKSPKAPESINFGLFGSDPKSSYQNPRYFSSSEIETRMIYVPVGSLTSYRYSTLWGYPYSAGILKELDMVSEKNVTFDFNFSRGHYPTITVNGKTATESYKAKPLEAITLTITTSERIDYFNDSTNPGVNCDVKEKGDGQIIYIYTFYPTDKTVISAGRTNYYQDGDFFFTPTYDGAKIIFYNTETTPETLDIPATLTDGSMTYPVTELGENLFDSKSIKHVSFPSSLKRICDYCFARGALLDLTFPDGIEEIGMNAFANQKNLHEIVFPASVRKIDSGAFSGCDLKSFNMPSGLRGKGDMLRNAGGSDGMVDLITIDESEEPLIYSACKAGRIVVQRPWNPQKIEARELEYDVDNVILDLAAVRDGDPELLQKLSIKGNSCHITGKINSTPEFNQYYHERKKLKLKDVGIDCSSLKIEAGAFADCAGLTSVDMKSNGGEGLAESVFEYCPSLKKASLSGIGGGFKSLLFSDCGNLASVKVNEGIEFINGIAFQGCKLLKRIEFDHSDIPVVIGTGAFDDCPVEEIFLDRDIVDPEPTFFRFDSLRRLELGNNLTRISDYSFADCKNLSEIYCESTTPPVIGPNTFRNVPTDKCMVYVKGGDGEYREAGGWKDFFPISSLTEVENSAISLESAAGVLTVSGAEGKRLAVYSVSGVRHFLTKSASEIESVKLNPGLYIVVAGTETFKINHK